MKPSPRTAMARRKKLADFKNLNPYEMKPGRAPALNSCPRCGGRHALMNLKRLINPPDVLQPVFAMCPKTGQPIVFLARYANAIPRIA